VDESSQGLNRTINLGLTSDSHIAQYGAGEMDQRKGTLENGNGEGFQHNVRTTPYGFGKPQTKRKRGSST